jgi:predicted amino acid-binding ACT domain protein
MNSSLVMTVIGPDRPGLVQIVAACVADHGGNWLESRMCHLGGQFAGLLRVEVEGARRAELARALQGLEAAGLRVIVHAEAGPVPAGQGTVARLELVGQDRPGILRSISAVLATQGAGDRARARRRQPGEGPRGPGENRLGPDGGPDPRPGRLGPANVQRRALNAEHPNAGKREEPRLRGGRIDRWDAPQRGCRDTPAATATPAPSGSR